MMNRNLIMLLFIVLNAPHPLDQNRQAPASARDEAEQYIAQRIEAERNLADEQRNFSHERAAFSSRSRIAANSDSDNNGPAIHVPNQRLLYEDEVIMGGVRDSRTNLLLLIPGVVEPLLVVCVEDLARPEYQRIVSRLFRARVVFENNLFKIFTDESGSIALIQDFRLR